MARTRPIAADADTVTKVRRHGLCRAIRRSKGGKCLLCSILIGCCLAYAFFCHFEHGAYDSQPQLKLIYSHGPCAQGYNFIPVVFGLMLYVVYILECWHARARHVDIKKVDLSEALQYLKQLRSARPMVWWKSVSYHYVRRTRQVTRYRNGDAVSATQVYYERVDSHAAAGAFLHDSVGARDISKQPAGCDKYSATRIRIQRGFVFACMPAAEEFEQQRARFFNENEARDDYMEVREGMELSCDAAYCDDCMCFPTGRPPWHMHPLTYWTASVLLMSWPLRVFSEWRTAYLNYQVTKLFGTNYLSPSSPNYTGPLTRASTIESIALEAALRREHFFVVPSYSEALLMPHNGAGISLFPPACSASNEPPVLRNYGALESAEERPGAGREPRTPSRSRSMTFRPDPPPALVPLRPGRRPPRSFSIGGLSSWSNGYRPIDEDGPLPDEPPPPYEVALRMCAPLYQRIRRSLSSRLNSLSHSNSKELKTVEEGGA